MRRKVFDALATTMGLVLAVVLLVAGGLLMWGYSFTNSQVHQQLASQQIVFPAKNSAALKELPPADAAAMSQYAGQLMTNGAQAHTYANNYIAVHLAKVANGQTYAQVSGQLQPPNVSKLSSQQVTTLKAEQATLFQGNTLRGLLLNAYAFWQVGQIALWASIASFVAAGAMLILSGMGFWHLRRVSPEAEILPGGRPHAHAGA